MNYITEDEKVQEAISTEIGKGCLFGTITIILLIVLTVATVLLSCGQTKTKPICEAYHTGNPHQKKTSKKEIMKDLKLEDLPEHVKEYYQAMVRATLLFQSALHQIDSVSANPIHKQEVKRTVNQFVKRIEDIINLLSTDLTANETKDSYVKIVSDIDEFISKVNVVQLSN